MLRITCGRCKYLRIFRGNAEMSAPRAKPEVQTSKHLRGNIRRCGIAAGYPCLSRGRTVLRETPLKSQHSAAACQLASSYINSRGQVLLGMSGARSAAQRRCWMQPRNPGLPTRQSKALPAPAPGGATRRQDHQPRFVHRAHNTHPTLRRGVPGQGYAAEVPRGASCQGIFQH